MRQLRKATASLLAMLWAAALPAILYAAEPSGPLHVVVTIKPLHALVAGVMAGAGTPDLLVKGSASPHTYALKPSDARALNHADVFFRASELLEPFTTRIVKSLPSSVEVVTLQQVPGLALLPRRSNATFGAHGKDADGGHGHARYVPPAGTAIDGHTWLDPRNAQAMVARIAQVLAARDPQHAALFHANAGRLKEKLGALDTEISHQLEPVAGKPYIVFHDALQYFERRYGLAGAGSISVAPDIAPSAGRLSELRGRITARDALCVFTEPQYAPQLVQNLVEGTPARVATLDPEGARLTPGPDLYFTLLRRLASDLRGCLAPQA
jgi:zinc transport system substrate-binding protein